jgi:hypothetical protein
MHKFLSSKEAVLQHKGKLIKNMHTTNNTVMQYLFIQRKQNIKHSIT